MRQVIHALFNLQMRAFHAAMACSAMQERLASPAYAQADLCLTAACLTCLKLPLAITIPTTTLSHGILQQPIRAFAMKLQIPAPRATIHSPTPATQTYAELAQAILIVL